MPEITNVVNTLPVNQNIERVTFKQGILFPEADIVGDFAEAQPTDTAKNAILQRVFRVNSNITTLPSDGEIIDKAKDITQRYTVQVSANRFGLKEDKAHLLLPVIPPIISNEAYRKIIAAQLLEGIKHLSAEQIQMFPPVLLKLLPQERLEKVFPDGIPKSIQKAEPIEPFGGFNCSEYFICLNPEDVRTEMIELNEVCPHEKNHADGALARTMLDILYPGEVDKTVRSYFKDKTINGCHLKYSDRPYFSTRDFAVQVADILDGLLLNFDKDDDLTITVNSDFKVTGKELTKSGKEKLGQIIRSHKDFESFKALYSGIEEDALNDIFNFLEASLNNYAKVSGFNSVHNHLLLRLPKEVVEELPLESLLEELRGNKDFIDYARRSAFGYIETMLGNESYQIKIGIGFYPLPDEVFGYLFSSEEYDCNMSAANWRVTNSYPATHKPVEDRINLFALCSRLKELRKQASTSVQNPEVVRAVNDWRMTTCKFGENESTLGKIIHRLEEDYPTVVADPIATSVIGKLKPLITRFPFERVSCNPAHLNHAYKYQEGYRTLRKGALALKMCLEKIDFPNQEVTDEPKVYKQQWIDALQKYIDTQDELLPRLLTIEESLNENWLDPINRLSPDDPIAVEAKEIEIQLSRTLRRVHSTITDQLKEIITKTGKPIGKGNIAKVLKVNSIDTMVYEFTGLLGELFNGQLRLPFTLQS